MNGVGRFNVTLAPIVSGEEDVESLAAPLAIRLASVLGAEVMVISARLDLMAAYDPARRQYRARRLLEQLEGLPGDIVLGLTGLDLFLPVFTFVFGEAMLGGRCGVVSTYRLAPERYGLPADPERLASRLSREAVHEIGHCLGLVHCYDGFCAMAASHDSDMIDAKGDSFCTSCRSRAAMPHRTDRRPGVPLTAPVAAPVAAPVGRA